MSRAPVVRQRLPCQLLHMMYCRQGCWWPGSVSDLRPCWAEISSVWRVLTGSWAADLHGHDVGSSWGQLSAMPESTAPTNKQTTMVRNAPARPSLLNQRQLVHGEQSHTQSLTQLIWCPSNQRIKPKLNAGVNTRSVHSTGYIPWCNIVTLTWCQQDQATEDKAIVCKDKASADHISNRHPCLTQDRLQRTPTHTYAILQHPSN